MSWMQMISTAKDLQRKAAALPLTHAPRPEQGGIATEHFAQVDRELVWGLTLNK